MRKAILIFAAVMFLAGASAAFADGSSINYTVTSTALPGGPFTITFAEPGTLSSLTTFTTATFTEGGISKVLPGTEVQFFDFASSGLFDVDFSLGGNAFQYEFGGGQSYTGTGPYSLTAGRFPIAIGDVIKNGNFEGFLLGGRVRAVATPEPMTLAMLGFGLAGLGILRKKKLLA
jgi:hypothetical protein